MQWRNKEALPPAHRWQSRRNGMWYFKSSMYVCTLNLNETSKYAGGRFVSVIISRTYHRTKSHFMFLVSAVRRDCHEFQCIRWKINLNIYLSECTCRQWTSLNEGRIHTRQPAQKKIIARIWIAILTQRNTVDFI